MKNTPGHRSMRFSSTRHRNYLAFWLALTLSPTLSDALVGAYAASLPDVGTPLPRRVLLGFDSREGGDIENTTVHRHLALPLEYLGYVLEYADVRSGLPTQSLAGRYAGVVTWFGDDQMEEPEKYRAFVRRQLDDHVRIVFIENVGAELDARSEEHTSELQS